MSADGRSGIHLHGAAVDITGLEMKGVVQAIDLYRHGYFSWPAANRLPCAAKEREILEKRAAWTVFRCTAGESGTLYDITLLGNYIEFYTK